jgi:hypothetical protein
MERFVLRSELMSASASAPPTVAASSSKSAVSYLWQDSQAVEPGWLTAAPSRSERVYRASPALPPAVVAILSLRATVIDGH